MKLAQTLAHLLLPRHTNNHKAKALHPAILIFMAFGIMLLQPILGKLSTQNGSVLGYAANISVDEVIRLTNQKRVENGLSALKLNTSLSKAASAKGAHMLQFDYWAHVAPDGTQPWKFFGDIGYKYKYAGENLARDFSNPESAVNAWMASPTHRENMLSNKYEEIGIGVVEGDLSGSDTTLIVQLFGTTQADSLAPEPVAAAVSTRAPQASIRPVLALATPVPTLEPSMTPASIKTLVSSLEAGTISGEGVSGRVLISPFSTAKGISMGIIGFTLVLFVIDITIISRRKIKRVTGRTVAHIAFFSMIFIIILIVQAGRIL